MSGVSIAGTAVCLVMIAGDLAGAIRVGLDDFALMEEADQ
jgi:hypothetical protein